MGQRQVRRLVIGAAAAVAVVAMAAPAGAAPTNSPSSLTFAGVECIGLVGQPPLVTDFTVVGNGNGIAHTGAGIFQPLALSVTINGEPDPEGENFVKPGARKAEWECHGETTFDTPEGSVTISFVALGVFHP
jgi:hypothetical protein